jgi:DNA gyrase subunit A
LWHGEEDPARLLLAAALERIIAVDLADNDQLVGVALTDGEREIILVSSGGKAIRFNENEVRHMGREATGVRGIRLGAGRDLIALIVVGEGHGSPPRPAATANSPRSRSFPRTGVVARA